jgi:hypothetical protein
MLKQRLEKESNSLAEIAGEIVDLLQVAAARNGAQHMRYRARELGGKLEIHPNYPSGVVVNCTIEDGTQIRLFSTLGADE